MSLVHYGFSREEALWMPVNEFYDYIQLINEQIDKENEESQTVSNSSNKESPKTFSDVFKGMKNPLS